MPGSDDFKVPPSGKRGQPEPLLFAEADDDVFSLSADPPKKPGKPGKPGSDSDVRLDASKPKKGKGDESVPTEEIALDFSGPGSAIIKGGSSAKLSAPKSSGKLTSDGPKGPAKHGAGDSSEFELSLDADSDDFELKLNADSSDEVALGEMPKDKDATGSGRRGGESGILARKPNDSGPSLEKADKPKPPPPKHVDTDSDSDVDFELTLDSAASVPGAKVGAVKPKPDADSDSEFELTLDDSSTGSSLDHAALEISEDEEKGDIFETDFEIPPMDESASEAVALDPSDTDLEASDLDVALDDSGETSGSEVVLLDDEAPAARRGGGRRGLGDVDLAEVDEDEDAAGALRGARRRRYDEDEEEEEDMVPASMAVARPVPWGPLPAIILLPTLVLTLVGGLVSFELLHSMWGYSQPRKPAAPIARSLADSFGMELKDQ